MDEFAELLKSQDVMKNPFEDPFVKARSSSPDPWASFGESSTVLADEHDAHFIASGAVHGTDTASFGDADGFHYTVPTHDRPHDDEHAASPEESQGEPQTPGTLASPGFHESIPDGFENAPQHEESQPPRSPSPPPLPLSQEIPVSPAPLATAPPTYSTFHRHKSEPSSSNAAAPQPIIHPQPVYNNPLGSSIPGGLEGSFAGLAIGRESFNGWPGSPFGPSRRPSSSARNRDDSDSSDDDRPILQSAKLSSSRVPSFQGTGPSSTTMIDTGLQAVFAITVDDPQKVGDPIRPYTMYTVHTKTTSPMFKKSSFSVLRRYSDFLWLYETLSLNNPGVVVPPVPEKNPYRRFDENFVQQRRFALEKCIQKIANHPILQRDPDLKMFLESDTFALDIKQRKSELAQEKGGLMASIGQSLAGPRFHETDEWFDKQKAYLDSLELQLKGLVKAIDLVAKHRSELSAATREFAHAISELSASDVGPQLSSAFAGLAEVEQKAQESHSAQSQEDVVTIMATVDEYARLINSVRNAFNSRIRTYHTWQSTDGYLKRVKQTHETNRAQGKLPSDQLSRSLSLVADAERRAMDAKQDFDQVSRLVKAEVARFEYERIEDFKSSLEAFLEGMISRQKQLIAAWENYQHRLLKVASPEGRPREEPIASSD